jgi:signal peptidase I
MPDESPVETRPEDGRRTDAAHAPTAPAGAPAEPPAAAPNGAAQQPGAASAAAPPGDPGVGGPGVGDPVAGDPGRGPGNPVEGGPDHSDGTATAHTGADAPDTPDEPPEEPAAATGGQPEKKHGSFLKELPILLVVAFGLALLIKTFLVQAFFIPSGSMEKTLHGCSGCSGDRVLVNKLSKRFHDPKQGDVVVFRGPESWAPEAQFAQPTNIVQKAFRAVGSAIGVAPAGEKDFVKRVIAIGGQTVECCDGNGRVLVDGKALDEPYVYISDPEYRPAPFGPVKVPEGRLWMMGDHRDESADSRFHIADPDQGTIGVDDVIGKAFVIVWPPSRWDTLGTPSTFAGALGTVNGAAPLVLSLGLVVPPWLYRRRGPRRRGRRGR